MSTSVLVNVFTIHLFKCVGKIVKFAGFDFITSN